MSFYDQYELLDLVRDDGVKTFRAREKAANRFVTIHLFSNPTAPIQAELLRKLRTLPSVEAARIEDQGSHLGSVYFVTDDLADHGGLLEWLTSVTKAGARTPETPRAAEPPISAVIEPAGQLKLNREFAELFTTAERPAQSAPIPPALKELPTALPPAKPRSLFLLVAAAVVLAGIFALYFLVKMQ